MIVLFSVAALPAKAQVSRRNTRANTTRREPSRAPHLDVSKINDPATQDIVGPHSQGDAVVRAEILLDRLKFSPGEIGAAYDDNFAKAIAAFQAASGLPAMGSVDAATWAALNNDQATRQVQQEQSQQNQGGNQRQPQGQQGQGPQPGSQDSFRAGSPKQGQPAPSQGPQGAQQPQAQPQQNDQAAMRASPRQANAPQIQSQGQPPPAIVSYVILPEDIAGPFTKVPAVEGRDRSERQMLIEARFKQLNYTSPLQLLAEKFHSSPRLLVELNPRKRFDKEGEQIQVPNVLTPAPQQAKSVVVDASTHSVTALDGGGKILAFYPATVGSGHDPLPVGHWIVKEIDRYPHFKYNPNLFWDAEDKRPRAVVAPGPRNPVGVVWIGLSKTHYGIHGTPQPSLIGQTQSHGCIRLTNWDASELAGMVKAGTPVLLEEGTPSRAQSQPASSSP